MFLHINFRLWKQFGTVNQNCIKHPILQALINKMNKNVRTDGGNTPVKKKSAQERKKKVLFKFKPL